MFLRNTRKREGRTNNELVNINDTILHTKTAKKKIGLLATISSKNAYKMHENLRAQIDVLYSVGVII